MKQEHKISSDKKLPAKKDLLEGEDYYINEQGYWVFMEAYHLKRGYCCSNGCRHCPYNKDKI